MSSVNGGWDGPSIVKDGLVLYLDAGSPNSFYPLTAGTTWKDISGNSNNGTLTNGPTYSTANGGSIALDGVDDYVQIANNNNLNSTTGTISIWFKYSSAPGNGSSMIGKIDSFGSTNGYNVYIYQGYVGAQIKTSTLSPVTNVLGSNISTNTWYNYTFTYESGVSHTAYLNNSSVSSGSCISFSISTQPLRIARAVDNYWSTFGGNIATTQIYNRALSSSEINQNFQATRARFGI